MLHPIFFHFGTDGREKLVCRKLETMFIAHKTDTTWLRCWKNWIAGWFQFFESNQWMKKPTLWEGEVRTWGGKSGSHLREPIDSHEDEKFEDNLEVPPGVVGVVLDARGPDPAGELEDEESVEDQVEKEEEEEGEVEEEEEGEELVETARLLQVGMEVERLVSKLLNEQSDKEK